MGAAGIALRPHRGAAVHGPLEAAAGVPAAEQDHRARRAAGGPTQGRILQGMPISTLGIPCFLALEGHLQEMLWCLQSGIVTCRSRAPLRSRQRCV